MSNTNGQVSFVKSMNGILSFNTGSGTIIEGDTITTDTIICDTIACPQLNADALQAYTSGAPCNLYTQTSGGASSIRIGNSGITLYIDSGIASTSPIYCSELHAANVYAGTSVNTTFLDTPNTTDTPYIYPFVTGAITIGSATSPIIGTRVCTNPTELANKHYVDTALSGASILGLTNIWTGASNTFNNNIILNTINATAVGATVNLYNNLTTGSLNIGTGIITGGSINMGTNTSGIVNIGTNQLLSSDRVNIGNNTGGQGTMNLGSKTINIGLSSTSIQIGNGMPAGGVGINVGSSTNTTTINGATLNLGSVNSTLNINAPINPNYDTKYTAFAGTPAGCIGAFVPATTFGGNFALTSTVSRTANTFTNLPIGVWLLYWNMTFYCPTTAAGLYNITVNMGTTATNADIYAGVMDSSQKTLSIGYNKSYLVTQIYTNTSASGDVYCRVICEFTGTLTILSASNGTNCKAVRIA